VNVDDTLFFSPNSDIHVLVGKLRTPKMEMMLLARVIEAIGIEGAHPKSSPSETKALPYDKTGNITQPSFNYASVIVMFRFSRAY